MEVRFFGVNKQAAREVWSRNEGGWPCYPSPKVFKKATIK